MLLFRSEEHVTRWYDAKGMRPGATMTVQQQWDLVQPWYAGRDSPDWQPRTPQESQAILASVGLVGDFWRLTPPSGGSG